MGTLSSGVDYIDLNFLGGREIIAAAVLKGPDGAAIIDPGPSTTMPHLIGELDRQGIGAEGVRQVLLTHIHLDHAGGVGSLLRRNPAIEVYVHERGAPHLVDPTKLLSSASRLYGQDMDRLWGVVLAVPQERVRMLKGGERLDAVGHELEVAYTPGHASHHVSYFDPATRIAFVGDTAGIRRGSGSSYVLPPTPPPDIDLEGWRSSADAILAWDPDTLFLTHFGPFHAPRPHFHQMFSRLDVWSRSVQRLLADPSLDDPARERRFVDACILDMRRAVGETEAEQYSRAGRLEYSWQGLARYWRNREPS